MIINKITDIAIHIATYNRVEMLNKILESKVKQNLAANTQTKMSQ